MFSSIRNLAFSTSCSECEGWAALRRRARISAMSRSTKELARLLGIECRKIR